MKRHNDIIMRSPSVKIKLKKYIFRWELCNKFPFSHCSKHIIATRMLSSGGNVFHIATINLMSLYRERGAKRVGRRCISGKAGTRTSSMCLVQAGRQAYVSLSSLV